MRINTNKMHQKNTTTMENKLNKLKEINKSRSLGFALFIFSLFLVSCTSESSFDKILSEFHNPDSEYVMVAAHRAAHNVHPENSLSAIQQAIDMGVDVIELDVKVSKDGVPFLMHDGTIDRTTNGTGDGEDYTIKELKSLKLKNNDGTLSDETIPTFEEALNLTKDKVIVDIDIKTSHLKEINEVVQKTKTVEQVFWFDNDYDALKEVLAMEKKSMLMPRAYSYEMADSALNVFTANVIHIDPSFNTKEVCDLIRNGNSRIWINALGDADRQISIGNEESTINELLKYGANVIQTDQPEKLINYLKSNGRRN
jgi:glycerophosphoryl diester phosphodiesterase